MAESQATETKTRKRKPKMEAQPEAPASSHAESPEANPRIGSELDVKHLAETGEVRAPIEPPTPFAWEPPPHFEPVPQDFLLYSPDRSQQRALLGLLVDEIEFPRDRSMGRALVLVLLEPVPLVTADGTLVMGRPGQEVLVEVTHFLRRLVRAARDPNSVGELWMRPVGHMRTDGGDTLTLWDIRGGKIFPRHTIKRGGVR